MPNRDIRLPEYTCITNGLNLEPFCHAYQIAEVSFFHLDRGIYPHMNTVYPFALTRQAFGYRWTWLKVNRQLPTIACCPNDLCCAGKRAHRRQITAVTVSLPFSPIAESAPDPWMESGTVSLANTLLRFEGHPPQ